MHLVSREIYLDMFLFWENFLSITILDDGLISDAQPHAVFTAVPHNSTRCSTCVGHHVNSNHRHELQCLFRGPKSVEISDDEVRAF